MVWHAWQSDGTKKYSIECRKQFESIVGHHLAESPIACATPIEVLPFERDTESPSGGLQNADTFRHHFRPNPVASDYRNSMICRKFVHLSTH